MIEDADFAEIHAGDLEGAPGRIAIISMITAICQTAKSSRISSRGCAGPRTAFLGSEPGPVLIVSHGGVFRAFTKLYGIDIPGVRNCHLHEFSPVPGLARKFPTFFPGMSGIMTTKAPSTAPRGRFHNKKVTAATHSPHRKRIPTHILLYYIKYGSNKITRLNIFRNRLPGFESIHRRLYIMDSVNLHALG
jgi:hypothetical protein